MFLLSHTEQHETSTDSRCTKGTSMQISTFSTSTLTAVFSLT